jgi:hypothetical protein
LSVKRTSAVGGGKSTEIFLDVSKILYPDYVDW